MKRSTERFLTTHTGSLPRPEDLIRAMYAKEEGVPVDPAALEQRIASAVEEVVRKQAEARVRPYPRGDFLLRHSRGDPGRYEIGHQRLQGAISRERPRMPFLAPYRE